MKLLVIKRRATGRVLCRIAVPERPYRNLADYLTKAYYGKPHVEGAYPCTHCGGDGWVYDPDDPPCPIEGNKMRTRLKCTACAGSKQGPRDAVVRRYNHALAQWREKKAQHVHRVREFTRLAQQLSDADLVLLRTTYGANDASIYASHTETVRLL